MKQFKLIYLNIINVHMYIYMFGYVNNAWISPTYISVLISAYKYG